MKRFALATGLLLVISLVPAMSSAQSDGVVFYYEGTYFDSVSLHLVCSAAKPWRTEFFADRGDVQVGQIHVSFGAFQWEEPTSQGSYVHAFGQDVTQTPRVETLTRKAIDLQGPAGGSPGRLFLERVVFAVWGVTPDCSLTMNGESVDFQMLPQAVATFVAPNEFATGVMTQQGYAAAAAGETYVSPISGLTLATADLGEEAAGAITMPTQNFVRPCNSFCGLSYDGGTRQDLFTFTLAAGVTQESYLQPALWLVQVPSTQSF